MDHTPATLSIYNNLRETSAGVKITGKTGHFHIPEGRLNDEIENLIGALALAIAGTNRNR